MKEIAIVIKAKSLHKLHEVIKSSGNAEAIRFKDILSVVLYLIPSLPTRIWKVNNMSSVHVFRIPDDGNPVILSVIHHRQNPLDSTTCLIFRI
jgi:hypothetical protein